MHFTYEIIRIWEKPRQEVIEQKLVGLYPLLPLMQGEPSEQSETVLRQSIETIQTVQEPALQKDLLAVMGILAGGKYTAEFVFSLIRREMLMESPVYQQWIKEEREEAKAEGRIEGRNEGINEGRIKQLQNVIQDYLARKFSSKANNLQQKVVLMSNLEILKSVLDQLYNVPSLKEARAVINDGIATELELKQN